MNRLLALLLCIFSSIPLWSHPKGIADTIFVIREINVSANRQKSFGLGHKTQSLDSLTLNRNQTSTLAQVLSQYSFLNFQTYGPGITYASTRGSGSAHTAVLWNDMNLQDLFNGGSDLSLIPTNFIDCIDIQYGGNSSLYGSGTIGGAIRLNNRPVFNRDFKARVNSEWGSFGNQYYGFNTVYSGSRNYTTIRAFTNEAKNNYPFNNYGTTEKLSNAQRKQRGVMVGNTLKTSQNSTFDINLWYQHNDQHIMSTMLETSNAVQLNDDFRSMAAWKLSYNNLSLNIRSGLNLTDMDYNHSNSYRTHQSTTEVEANIKLNNNWLWNIGTGYVYEKGISADLVNNSLRKRTSAFSSLKYVYNNRLFVSGSLRSEMINEKLSPATFSIGSEFVVIKELALKGNIAKNYRVPSFNDLFWAGWGNPDLHNESGICTEAGLVNTLQHTDISLRQEITGFSNRITNWIQWQPIGTSSVWHPINIGKVWARGLEYTINTNTKLNDWAFRLNASYSYTLSTQENLDVNNPSTYQKQLIYVPKLKGSFNLNVDYKKSYVSYTHAYSSSRYTVADNSDKVKSYYVGNLKIGQNFAIQKVSLGLSFSVNNLWNRDYQVVKFYPMPFRNYLISIQINFN